MKTLKILGVGPFKDLRLQDFLIFTNIYILIVQNNGFHCNIFFLCYMYIYVCLWHMSVVCAHECAGILTHVEARGGCPQVFSSVPFQLISLKKVLSLNWKLTILARLLSTWAMQSN